MKEKRKQEKGITLIALVITIIVLLILAGVTIHIVMNTGIIDNSKKAVNTYKEQQARDKLNMALLNYQMSQYTDGKVTLEDAIKELGGTITKNEEAKEYDVQIDDFLFKVDSESLQVKGDGISTGGNSGAGSSGTGGSSGGTTTPGGESGPQEPEKTGYTIEVAKGEGIESVSKTEDENIHLSATLTNGYVFDKWEIGGLKNENETDITVEDGVITITATAKKAITEDNIGGTDNRTYTGAVGAYNNPVIPAGFKVSDKGASWISRDGKTVEGWNDGLVIEDSDGNEFVWVPVHDEADGAIPAVPYAKWCTTGMSYNETTDDSRPQNVNSWYASYGNNGETGQVTKYGGFYIGRYEAGKPDSGTIPLSKKGQTAWVDINYTNSKAYAESMYANGNVQSGLLTGTMWDTTLKWLQNSGVNVTGDQSWGNTGGPIKTGTNDGYKRNNIYDLSGNVGEWTNESHICRGMLWSLTVDKTADYRSGDGMYITNSKVGFRVALYIR